PLLSYSPSTSLIYTLSLHDALPIWLTSGGVNNSISNAIIKNSVIGVLVQDAPLELHNTQIHNSASFGIMAQTGRINAFNTVIGADRKSTRLNSSHVKISYAVFCLKK